MRRKDPVEAWEEDGGVTLMRDFFERAEPTLEEKERIKEMAWAKFTAHPSYLHEEAEFGLDRTGRTDAGKRFFPDLAGKAGRQVSTLWCHWGWKLAIPLTAVILIWSGWGLLNPNVSRAPSILKQMALGTSGGTNSAVGPAGGVRSGHVPASSNTRSAAGSDAAKSSVSAPGVAQSTSPDVSYGSAAQAAPDFTAKGATEASQSALPRKVTQNLAIEVQVAQVQAAIGQVSAETEKLGGYVVDMQQTSSDSGLSGHITVKVPAGKMQDMQGKVSALGKVLNEHLTSNDVTDQYYDTQTLLENWQAEEKQYLKILGQAHTVDEILKVENSLSNVRGQIQLLEGRLKLMNNQVDYATIDLQLIPVPNPNLKISTPWQPVAWDLTWQSVQAAFLKTLSGSWNVLNYFLIGLGYAAPYGILAAAGWLIYRIWIKFRRKR